jgi:hypothetical protein
LEVNDKPLKSELLKYEKMHCLFMFAIEPGNPCPDSSGGGCQQSPVHTGRNKNEIP